MICVKIYIVQQVHVCVRIEIVYFFVLFLFINRIKLERTEQTQRYEHCFCPSLLKEILNIQVRNK